MIKGFTPRLYQETILATAAARNTLVVLPTGLGKTNIFLMLAAHRLKLYPDSKILFIGPTRPLIDQYMEVFKKHLNIAEEKMAVLTGMVAAGKRGGLWEKASVIFSTPQGLENDLLSGKISLEDVVLLGFDEAHRAVKEYSYVWIAKHYMKTARFPRVLALTASPGSDLDKISEVCRNLSIEDIEVRTEADPDVKPYIQEIEIDWVKVDLPPEFAEVKKLLDASFRSKLEVVKNTGYLRGITGISKKELLELQASLRSELAGDYRNFPLLRAISSLAEAMKVGHALELLETQGITALQKYFDRLREDAKAGKTKAAKRLFSDNNFLAAIAKTQQLHEKKIEHPKIDELKRIIKENIADAKGAKAIVFNHYRDSALKLQEELNQIEGIRASIFVGQMKKGETGLSQKQQRELLDKFTAGEFNVIIATSIGEEGLDIPKVDLVVFYEPIPSAIRQIQRRGRTGRQEKGKVTILMTRNTRDETFRWVAHHKEKRMHRILKTLKSKLKLEPAGQKQLDSGKFS
ncbi:DEAD/DEAH box helicase [Candidatus Woesearchaeota archaeon]|nr:DEAD/DEAH box helicase [Candidatus Woesearchaeota archaeon]